jgi:hypothetical protein
LEGYVAGVKPCDPLKVIQIHQWDGRSRLVLV